MLLRKPEGCAVRLGTMVQLCFAREFGGCRHGDLALPERCGPGLTRQAANHKPCQPPQVLHRGCKVELLGRTLQPAQPQTQDPELLLEMGEQDLDLLAPKLRGSCWVPGWW